jgi:hypothetical protein
MKKVLVCAVVVLGGLAQLVWAGGQQVTAQPADDGRSVVVRTFRCGTPQSFTVHGAAEGVVAGARKSIPLAISRTGEEGVFRVARQWPEEGKWVLVFNVEGDRPVSTLVELGPGATIRIASQKTTYERPSPAAIRAALATTAPAGSR